MSRLTLRLPTTLHQRLLEQADREGVSLNQYLVYLLAQGSTSAYRVFAHSEEDVAQQRRSFARLLEELGPTSHEMIQAALDAREPGTREPELSPEVVETIRRRISARRSG